MKKPQQFGKYYLLERVNVGGMAEVFKAKTVGVEGFERLLAVKRILPAIAEDKEFIAMFIDEAKIAVQLSHANIAQIFDLGKVDGSYFIALEYVAGKDLRALFDRCRRRPENGATTMPIAQACFIVMKACEGLDFAHNKRDATGRDLHLVHRDVSPQNILISYEGEVKLIDFGIAKAAGKASKTQAGILKGKFGYMSPEQVRGLPLDRRSDVFSVGIVLYELLTGERLFLGGSDFSTLEKVRNVEVLPPSAYNRKIPGELERIVLRALAKDVEDRYQNAIDLHDDLQAWMYSAREFFSRKDLSAWMKHHFAAEIEAEVARDEEYGRMAPLATPSPAPVRPARARSLPPPPPPPPVPPSARPAGEPATVALARAVGANAPPAAIADDLSWDDDELDTNVYGDGRGAQARGAGRETGADTAITSLDEFELSDDGAPVPARRTEPTVPAVSRTAPVAQGQPGEAACASGEGVAGSTLTPTADILEVCPDDGGPSHEEPTRVPDAQRRQPVVAPTLITRPKPKEIDVADGAAARAAQPAPATSVRATIVPAGTVPFAEAATLVRTPAAAVTAVRVDQANRPPAGVKARVAGRRSTTPIYLAVGIVSVAGLALSLYFVRPNAPTSGRIQVATFPGNGVRILLDGQEYTAADLEARRLTPGAHALRVEANGYRPYSEEVAVKAGEVAVQTVTLEPLRANLILRSDPAGATATLDGRVLGQTPFQAAGLAPGRHLLEVRAGARSWSQNVELEAGGTIELHAALAGSAPEPVASASALAPPAPAAPRAARPVTVAAARPTFAPSKATAARASPDGESGSRRRASAPPKATRSDAVATKGATSPPSPSGARPEPAAPKPAASGEGYLRIGSKPWTRIAVDGKDSGLTTPQTHLRLNAGPHRIMLFNPQFGISESFSVQIKPGATETIVKDLRPRTGSDGD